MRIDVENKCQEHVNDWPKAWSEFRSLFTNLEAFEVNSEAST